ncbi:hypothetical protein RJ639_028938 [Escallonia herrerae]|uniref:Uncharacterized protein n=1 Tax=Escallonia herrerae TaxID=1293975 RepID=A0AA88X617_9ASTE|nr:hypothetical protein RJ639_028938 [Escallonia herrerae]
MEGSESETIFDSLHLNPQLFINEVLNRLDDLLDGAFLFFRQQASTQLKVEGADRSDDLTKGVAHIRNMIQSNLDKRLAMWEKYCLMHCFVVPEGFSLRKTNESCDDNSVGFDDIGDSELDAQLDTLRDKLTSVGKESAELNKELRALERQSTLNNHSAASLYGKLLRTASEFRAEVEKLKAQRVEESERKRNERLQITGDSFLMNRGNGLSGVALEELQGFVADLETL